MSFENEKLLKLNESLLFNVYIIVKFKYIRDSGKEMLCMFNVLGKLMRIEVCKEVLNNKFIEW